MKTPKLMRRIGRVCFTVMWIPFITGFIGMIGVPEGSYDFIELPLLTRISMVLGGVLAVGSTVLLVGAAVVTGRINSAILKHGREAEATILKLTDTGTRINNDPLVRLLLEVQPPGEPSFQTEAERIISQLQIPQVQPGNVLHVKFDPATRNVAIMNANDNSTLSP